MARRKVWPGVLGAVGQAWHGVCRYICVIEPGADQPSKLQVTIAYSKRNGGFADETIGEMGFVKEIAVAMKKAEAA